MYSYLSNIFQPPPFPRCRNLVITFKQTQTNAHTLSLFVESAIRRHENLYTQMRQPFKRLERSVTTLQASRVLVLINMKNGVTFQAVFECRCRQGSEYFFTTKCSTKRGVACRTSSLNRLLNLYVKDIMERTGYCLRCRIVKNGTSSMSFSSLVSYSFIKIQLLVKTDAFCLNI